MRNLLLDTGALIALLDRSEKNHARCIEFFKSYRGQILSTEPVLTEAVYLCGPRVSAQQVCIEFFLKGGALLVPQSHRSLLRASHLMHKYSDVPMDFADATLVVLAEESDVHEIFTLDLRGFRVYRVHGKKAFTIWPD